MSYRYSFAAALLIGCLVLSSCNKQSTAPPPPSRPTSLAPPPPPPPPIPPLSFTSNSAVARSTDAARHVPGTSFNSEDYDQNMRELFATNLSQQSEMKVRAEGTTLVFEGTPFQVSSKVIYGKQWRRYISMGFTNVSLRSEKEECILEPALLNNDLISQRVGCFNR